MSERFSVDRSAPGRLCSGAPKIEAFHYCAGALPAVLSTPTGEQPRAELTNGDHLK